MNRRAFLTSTAVSSVVAVSGCVGRLRGSDDNAGPAEGVRRDETNSPGDSSAYRIDFVDQAGTLGQVAQPQAVEDDYNNIVNEYSEDGWGEIDRNDLDVARSVFDENETTVGAFRPYIEDQLQDSPEGEAAARALIRGIGWGKNDEVAISGSVDAAIIVKSLSERFAGDYLDTDYFQAWITPATIPVVNGSFAHLPVTIAYEHEGDLRRDYIHDAVLSAPGVGENEEPIRRPENSVYADPGEMEMVTGHEYRKALKMAERGEIAEEGDVHPIRAVSSAVLANLWNIVDSAQNDFSFENPPPHGLVVHISQEFGRSVEDAFYDLTEQRLGYMENVGRGMQLFYEMFDGRSNLAVGGRLDTPEFYIFPDSKKETAWNFEYDDISELAA